MKVKAKVDFETSRGFIKKGTELEVKPSVANRWFKEGYVIKVKE
jgi:hypothetical protein